MLYFIYKLTILNSDLFYIGSTSNINRRILQHKYNLLLDNQQLKAYHYKLYKSIRENGGWDNCLVEVIETIECDNCKEAKIKEQQYIDTLSSNLNSIKSHTTITKKERDKQYYDNTKDTKRKEYLNENKERIKEYNHEKHINNQEKNLQIAKQYREKYPERIKENNKKQTGMPPILCECGKYYTYKHKARHLKSKYHIDKKV